MAASETVVFTEAEVLTVSKSIPYWDQAPEILQQFGPDANSMYKTVDISLTKGGFEYAPTPWDIVTYGTQKKPIPGLAIIKDVTRQMKLDKKDLVSTDGVSSTFHGMKALVFRFDLLIWTFDQLDDMFNTVLPVIFPGHGQPVAAHTVTQKVAQPSVSFTVAPTLGNPGQQGTYTPTPVLQTTTIPATNLQIPVILGHPALCFHQVNNLIVEKLEGPRQWGAHNDIYYLSFHCIEYKPSRNVQSYTPNAVAPSVTAGNANPRSVNQAQSLDPSTNSASVGPGNTVSGSRSGS